VTLQHETKQICEWTGHFGREYTDRNALDPTDLDALWVSKYGVTRTLVNQKLFGIVPKNARILEVGCNVGNQLLLLQGMGYCNLYGIDVQEYAIQLAKTRLPKASIIQGSVLDIPFPDGHFDLVFTSGLLIHIAPADLPRALSEIHRVAMKWILGSEYYAPSSTEINYRGHEDLLWKDDFAKMYLREFADLHLLQEERLSYLNSQNIDSMFLLQRLTAA
jgi:pseudaminic acid biosynthesis-associated methylase